MNHTTLSVPLPSSSTMTPNVFSSRMLSFFKSVTPSCPDHDNNEGVWGDFQRYYLDFDRQSQDRRRDLSGNGKTIEVEGLTKMWVLGRGSRANTTSRRDTLRRTVAREELEDGKGLVWYTRDWSKRFFVQVVPKVPLRVRSESKTVGSDWVLGVFTTKKVFVRELVRFP